MRPDDAEEMNACFTAVTELHAFTAAVIYQHVGLIASLEPSWAGERLIELAGMIERESPKMSKPQFATAYAEILNRIAGRLNDPSDAGPRLTLIDGGKSDGA